METKILDGEKLHVGLIFNFKGNPSVIISGQYIGGFNRISNFWYWRRILKDGRLGSLLNGYGGGKDFTVCEDKFEIRYIKK